MKQMLTKIKVTPVEKKHDDEASKPTKKFDKEKLLSMAKNPWYIVPVVVVGLVFLIGLIFLILFAASIYLFFLNDGLARFNINFYYYYQSTLQLYNVQR